MRTRRSAKPAFSIVIPPPNITGVLTLGHVLNNTIQDILARRARMTGHEVLWLPGTDHAGVATQTAVEKHLSKTEKKKRQDYGREEFLRRVVEWQDKHGGIIIEQLKRLGCSCDWARLRYTFDDGLCARGAAGVCRSSQERADLSREADDQLGSGGADRAFGRGSDSDETEERALLCALRNRRAARAFSRSGDDAAGDDHGRRGAGGASERCALSAIDREEGVATARARGDSGAWRTR